MIPGFLQLLNAGKHDDTSKKGEPPLHGHLPPSCRTIDTLNWDHSQLRALPICPDKDALRQPRHVSGACLSHASPSPVDRPSLIVAVPSALELIDLPPDDATTRPQLVECLSGNQLPMGAMPTAQCYCGHQFGVFAGQLGDGAAISLGGVLNSRGDRWEVQLKGAGTTHYSRKADGRKVLRSSLRELLASENAHALGIPTTRAAALVTSDTFVARDINYDGHAIKERASILTRLAPSFLRFGSFEICDPRGGPSPGDVPLLETLLDHTAAQLGKSPKSDAAADVAASRLDTFGEMVERTARLVASWMCFGFCHGVLNTDNMSVLGMTLDYGPYGFMETYDPEYVCNASDQHGMYAYHRQPEVCRWNCERLADALAPVVPTALTKPLLARFDDVYFASFSERMLAKLGIAAVADGDDDLLQGLLGAMQRTGADWTASFRALCDIALPPFRKGREALALAPTVERIVECCASPQQLAASAMQKSLELGAASAEPADAAKSEALRRHAEELSRAPASVKRTHDVALWSAWLARYAERLLKEEAAKDEAVWRRRMRSTNPRVVLRNWIAQEAIDAASSGDIDVVRKVLDAVTRPYDEANDEDGERYALPLGTVEGRCVS